MNTIFPISSKTVFSVVIFFFFFILILFSGCTPKSVSPEKIVILIPPSTSSIPFYYLADTDPIEGTDIIIQTFTDHSQALALLLRGDADYLFTGTTQGWESYWSGNPMVAVSSYVWAVSSLCVGNPEIRSIHDLKGKTIVMPFKNSPLDIQTRIILTKTGLLPDTDVKIVYSAFTASIVLLKQGKIHAAAFPEPLATNLVKNKGLFRLFEYIEAWKGVTGDEGLSPQVTLYSTNKIISGLRDFTAVLHMEIGKAIEIIYEDSDMVAEKYSEQFQLPGDVVAEAIQKTHFKSVSGAEHKADMIKYYEIIKSYLPGKSEGLSDSFFY